MVWAEFVTTKLLKTSVEGKGLEGPEENTLL